MTPTSQFGDGQSIPLRVSIFARLIPALSLALPALGAALSSILFVNLVRAMRDAEHAGVAAVAGAMAEANIPLLVTLYLSILLGLAGIVVVLVLRKSSLAALPSTWFFLVAAVIGLLPVCLFWKAESLLVQALYPGSAGVAEVAQRIVLLITLAPIAGVAGALILLVASLMPLPAFLRAKRVFPALLILIIIELALIGMAVTVTMRTSWFLKVKETERL
jgi:hypothetical protein